MTRNPEDYPLRPGPNQSWDDIIPIEDAEPNLDNIDYPSDALTLKRLRTTFPVLFHRKSLFEWPHDWLSSDADLEIWKSRVRLTDLIHAEHIVVGFSFGDAIKPHPRPGSSHTECEWACQLLELKYQEFRLADSPETARFLIQKLEKQGRDQANRLIEEDRARGR
jgi:hypothetical protein